jgi:hypothetical protein
MANYRHPIRGIPEKWQPLATCAGDGAVAFHLIYLKKMGVNIDRK